MNNDGQIRFRVNSNHEVTSYTQTFLEAYGFFVQKPPQLVKNELLFGYINITDP